MNREAIALQELHMYVLHVTWGCTVPAYVVCALNILALFPLPITAGTCAPNPKLLDLGRAPCVLYGV